jgi:hypothetical protein
MTQKPCACFGYVILQNTYPQNNEYEVQTESISNTTLFLTQGRMIFRNKQTKDITHDYTPGSFVSEWSDELSEVLASEESVLFCLTAKLNRGYIPEVESVILSPDNVKTYDSGTKFFLCQGIIEINEVEFVGPCQIGFKNTQSLKTKTDVYALIIK